MSTSHQRKVNSTKKELYETTLPGVENQQHTSNATNEINVDDEIKNILIDAELWVNNPTKPDLVFKTTVTPCGSRKICLSNDVVDELLLQRSVSYRKGYSGDVRDKFTDLIVQRITVNEKYRRQGVATNLLTNLAISFDHVHLQQCISGDSEKLAKSLIEKHGWYKQRDWLGGDLNVFSPVKKREPWWQFIIRETMKKLNQESGACFVKSFEEQVEIVKKELTKHYRKYDYEHGKIEKCLPIWVSELSNTCPQSRTVNMFLQSGKMLHEPNLKDIYEVMRSRETQMEWFRYQLCQKIHSNATTEIEAVQAMWIKHYRRYLEPLGIANFVFTNPESFKVCYDKLKNDYYLETVWDQYDQDRYIEKFKCEPFTNPTFDEHEKKFREAFNKRNDWIRTIKYLETRYGIEYANTPYDKFADAYGEWLNDHEAPMVIRETRKKKRNLAEANSEPAAKKRKVEDSSAPKFKPGNWYYNLNDPKQNEWNDKVRRKVWYYVHRRIKILGAEYIDYSCPVLTGYKEGYLTEKIERATIKEYVTGNVLADGRRAEYIDVKHPYLYKDGKSTLGSEDKFMGDVTMDTIFKSEVHRRMKQLFVSYSEDAARKDLEIFKEAKIIEELKKEKDRLNKVKADKNPTGSNPHDVKSDMMKSGIAGENKGNCQMSGAPFYNDFEQKIVTEHIAKWPDDKPEDLGQFLASVQQGGGLITKSSTLEVMHRNNPVAGTFLLAYLLKAAKISIVLHSQLKEDNGRNVMCNIRNSSYLGYPPSQFGLTEHCKMVNFKLWIETKHFPAVCAINKRTCILDFDITETGKVLKIFVCLSSDD